MTDRERFEINELKQSIMQEFDYTCQCCLKPAVFLAHRIAQTKSNIKRYGAKIIHHRLNLVPVCENPSCNDHFNIGNNPGEIEKLLKNILLSC